jgi:hypothetical protein
MSRHRLTAAERAEREAARRQKYAVAREEREVQREHNRIAWITTDQRNAGVAYAVAREKLVAAIEEPPPDVRSLDKLRAIMLDRDASIGRRVDAAEAVLAYELPAAALAQSPDQAINSSAYLFLQSVAATDGVPEVLQFRALKAIAAIETAKPRQVDPSAAAAERELMRQMINSHRRIAMLAAGAWPPAAPD